MARLGLLICVAFLALAGCGGASGGTDRPNEEASLLLDFTPNAVHAGIYLATERDYDDAEGVQLEVRAPGASTDALRLLQAGKVDMAILDIHDLALARERGIDIVGVMALVQRPLAAVLAQPEIARPRDLEGKRAGVSGLPSDVAVLRSVIEGDGGDPDAVRTTTIGFQAVKALLANRVAAATAFWNVEGVALKTQRPQTREFRVDDYGAPPYPELVLCVTRTTLDEQRPVLEATVRALRRGYTETQNDPESALSALGDANPDLDRDAASAQLDAVAPAFTAGADYYGQLREDVLEKWAAWDLQFGIVKERIDVGSAFDRGLAAP
ncbi:MAG TPA: ABC transporter substrate-binding protein [Solirubrobacteraceae bacterium]|nr:ABC transporter substrate-binding protein [Solirubrobacteraceae bacterium]